MLALVLITIASAAPCPPNAAPFTRPTGITVAEQVQYANLFTVTYYETYKVIKYNPTQSILKSSWPNSAMVGQSPPDLVLYECGTAQPTTSYNDVSANAQFFSVPIDKASLPWTGSLHFFELLSVTEAIHAIDMTYISSPCAQLLEVCTPGIHARNFESSWMTLALGSQAVFTDSWGSGASNSTKDVVFDVSTDGGILHRAEWIRFLAAFFNLEVLAGQIFDKIEGDYKAMQAEATELKTARSSSGSSAPSVAWVTWQGCTDSACDGVTPGNWVQKADGNWCRCGSFYSFYNSHFRRDVTEDAGARLLPMPGQAANNCQFLGNSDGSQTYQCDSNGLEHFLQHLAEADMIVDETFVSNHGAYSLDDFVTNFGLTGNAPSLKAREAQAVYRIDGSTSDARDDTGHVGSAWMEQMPTQPQLLLSDMMHAIWGSAFRGGCAKTYLRNLYTSNTRDPLQHTDCPKYDASGNHDCAGIHAYEHEVHQCASPSQSINQSQDPLVLGLGLGLGIPLGLLVIALSAFLVYRWLLPGKATAGASPSGASPATGGGAVVGIPVSDAADKP